MYVPISVKQDESSHWYIVPESELAEFSAAMESIYEAEAYSDDWECLVSVFEYKFDKYRTGGDLNNYQLFISEEELKNLTGE